MYKIIIVDDFHVERSQAESIILGSGLPLKIIGLYDNAEDALCEIDKNVPDIILSDIQMPGMDGILFVRNVLKKHPNIKPIFFSFYDKFAYVKDAIDLNASAYILKPINPEEMCSVLQNVISQLQKEKETDRMSNAYRELLNEMRPLLKERFARAIFGGELSEQAVQQRSAYFKIDLLGAQYVAVVLDADLVQISDYETGELIAIELEKCLKNQSEQIPFIWCRDTYNRYQFLFYRKEITSDSVMQAMLKALDVLDSRDIQYLAIVSSEYSDLLSSGPVCKQLRQLMGTRLKSGVSEIFFENEMTLDFEDDSEINSVCDEICNAVLNLQTDDINDTVKKLTSLYQNSNSTDQLKNACLLLISKLQLRFYDLDVSLFDNIGSLKKVWTRVIKSSSISEIKGLLNELLLSAIEAINKKRRNIKSQKVTEEVKRYVTENYSEPITVKDIATAMHYNSNYLNNLFKQVTGNTILEYLTQYRINKAKELLKSSNLRQSDIAYQVGYKNEQYFKKLFQSNIGLSPKEYRIVSGGGVTK